MKMYRAQFIMLAEVIRTTSVRYEWERSYTVQIAEELKTALRDTNPNFDADRFLRACYGEK